MTRRFDDFIADLERPKVHWGAYLATFVALVVVRNLIEGALGPEGDLGFTYAASSSALMVLDHFLLFYVTVFLGLSIVLGLLAREEIAKVMRVVTAAWAIILIPPVLDHLVTGGEGVGLSYITDLRSVVLRFFDPGESLERVSLGQRVEVLAACLLAAAYVRAKTASWLRALSAFLLAYLVIAAAAIIPSAYARLAWALSGGGAAPPELAYDAAYKAGGIVADESRKLALLFFFAASALGWLAFRLQSPLRERAFRRGLRPVRALHYAGMTPFGIALGWAVFSRAGVGFAGGGDVLGAAGLCLATFLAFQASVSINDLFDEPGDRVAGARRPLVEGTLSRRDVATHAAVLSSASLILALNVKYSSFLILALALAVSFFYSAPPIRLKRVPVVGTLALGVASLLACLVGFSAFAEERSIAVFPARLGWLIVLSFGLGFAAKDLKDVEGDRATGVVTLPVLLGSRVGRAAVAACVFAGFALVPVFLPFPALAAPAVGFGVASVLVIYRWSRPRLDDVLLGLSLAFTLIVAVFAIVHIDRVAPESGVTQEAKAEEIRGRRAESLREWPVAAEAYSAATRILPHDADLARRAGLALFESSDLKAAWLQFFEADALDPSNPMPQQYLALAESRLGLREEAEARMETEIRRNVRPRIFHALLGEHYMLEGEPERAIGSFRTALALGQPDVPARLRLAEALEAAGLRDEARAEYEVTVQRRPSSPEAHEAYGRFLNGMGDLRGAVGEFAESVRLDPAEPVYWNNLGGAYRDLGEFGKSLAALDQATRLAPRMLDPYYNRGALYLQVGRKNEARRQFLLALEIDPSFAPAREALGRLSGDGG